MTTKRLYIPESEKLYDIIGRQQVEIERKKEEIKRLKFSTLNQALLNKKYFLSYLENVNITSFKFTEKSEHKRKIKELRAEIDSIEQCIKGDI